MTFVSTMLPLLSRCNLHTRVVALRLTLRGASKFHFRKNHALNSHLFVRRSWPPRGRARRHRLAPRPLLRRHDAHDPRIRSSCGQAPPSRHGRRKARSARPTRPRSHPRLEAARAKRESRISLTVIPPGPIELSGADSRTTAYLSFRRRGVPLAEPRPPEPDGPTLCGADPLRLPALAVEAPRDRRLLGWPSIAAAEPAVSPASSRSACSQCARSRPCAWPSSSQSA